MEVGGHGGREEIRLGQQLQEDLVVELSQSAGRSGAKLLVAPARCSNARQSIECTVARG